MNFLEAYGIKPKMTSDLSDKKPINLFDFSNIKKPSEIMAQTTMAQPKQAVPTTKGRGATSLFSDEIKAFNDMLKDGVDETEARQVITDRRKDLLGAISQKESAALSKMIEDGLDTMTAVQIVNEQRAYEKKQAEKELNPLQKAGLGLTRFTGSTLAGGVGQVGGIADFVSGGDSELGTIAMEGRQTQRDIMGDSKLGMAGEMLGAGIIDYGIGKGLGKTAGLGTKFDKLSTGKQLLTGGAGFGALTAVGEKGSEATAGDIAMGAGIGAGAGAVLGKVVIPAIAGTVQKGMKYGTALQKGGVQGVTKSISRDLTKPLGALREGVQGTADTLATNINRMTKGEIQKFQKEYKVSPGKFLNDRGISESGDDLVNKLSKNLTKSRQEADKGIQSIKGNFKAPKQQIATDILDETTGTYKVIDSDPVETMLKDNLTNASNKGLSKDSLRAKQLLEKYQKEGLSMSEINEGKRWFQANNKFSYLTDDTSSRKGFVTGLDNTVREWQFDTAKKMGFENLKEINKQTKAYYQLLEGITKWNEGSKGNLPMGLTDWLAFNADPSIFLAKQVAESGTLKKGIIKTLNLGRKTQAEVKPALLNKSKTNVNNINSSNNSSVLESSKLKNVKPTILKESKPLPQTLAPKKLKETPKQEVKKPVMLKESKPLVKKDPLDFIGNQTIKGKTEYLNKEINSLEGKIKEWKSKGDITSLSKARKAEFTTIPELKNQLNISKNIENLTTENIDSVAKSFTNDAQKLAKIKVVIREHIKKYGEEFKNYMAELVDKISDSLGTRMKLLGEQGIGRDKTALLKGSDELKQIKKLNTGEDIVLVRGTGGGGNGAGEAIRGKGLYLTDNIDVANHYGKNIEKITIKNSDILDGDEVLKNSKNIIKKLPKEMQYYLDDTGEYTYNRLIRDIEGNTGLEAEKIAEVINTLIKDKYKGVKFNIGLVNDTLLDKGLGDKNAFIFFPQANKPKLLKKK